MPSAAALAELRLLLDIVAPRSRAALEKMPVEAPDDPQQETGCADEPADLRDTADRPASRQAARTGSGSRRSAVERRRVANDPSTAPPTEDEQ